MNVSACVCGAVVEDFEHHAVRCSARKSWIAKVVPDRKIAMTVQNESSIKDKIRGIVKSVDITNITIYHEEGGVATFPLDDIVGKPTIGTKKVKVKLISRESDEEMNIPLPIRKPPTKRNSPKDGAPTRMDIVTEIYAKHSDKSRKEVIVIIVAEANMTPAGASTYYTKAKKEAAAA